MNITPIKNEQDYQKALSLIEPYFDKEYELDTIESDYLIVMSLLIENYEKKFHSIVPPELTSADVLKYKMEHNGLTIGDLSKAIGKPNRVYEILNGKRKLTLPMIRNLHKMYDIPLESLIV